MTTNKAIGPKTSLIYLKELRSAEIRNNLIQYAGHVSMTTFEIPRFSFTPIEHVDSSEQVREAYAQYFGVFYFETVNEVSTKENGFKWCGAK